jgi:hypothetical protein
VEKISRSFDRNYLASPEFEVQFSKIRNFIAEQDPPESLLEQGIFLEILFTFLVSNFDKKYLDQNNFMLAIIDLMRGGSCTINDSKFEIDQNYLESEDFYFNFEWKDFVEPIIQLCEKGMFYPAFLLLSIYSNLASPYGAAYGYDGSDEEVKISFLEYLISSHNADPSKLQYELKKMYIPKSNPHFELEESEMRQVGISESAVLIHSLKNNLISDFNSLSLTHFVYGIILGKIEIDNIKLFFDKNRKFNSEEVDSIIWNIDILLQGDTEEYRQNDLILNHLVKSNFESLSQFMDSSSANTLIEFLFTLIKFTPDLDYSGIHAILNTFIISNNKPDLRQKYIIYLSELGGELQENPEVNGKNSSNKKGFFSKLLKRK